MSFEKLRIKYIQSNMQRIFTWDGSSRAHHYMGVLRGSLGGVCTKSPSHFAVFRSSMVRRSAKIFFFLRFPCSFFDHIFRTDVDDKSWHPSTRDLAAFIDKARSK